MEQKYVCQNFFNSEMPFAHPVIDYVGGEKHCNIQPCTVVEFSHKMKAQHFVDWTQ